MHSGLVVQPGWWQAGGARVPDGWNGRSHGGSIGMAVGAALARWGGRAVCYVLLALPSLWIWVRDGRARRANITYWRRMRPEWSVGRCALRSLLHFWGFARTLVDRVLQGVASTSLDFEQVNIVGMEEAMRHPRGCILLSAHLGSFELSARWLAQRPTAARINLVMLDGEDPGVQRQLAKSMGARPYGVIDLRDPLGASLEIVAALGRGETCCMLGDRTAGDPSATCAVNFLGGTAHLPTGPFIAAAITGAVIVPTFCCRTGWATWTCEADAPWPIDLGPRAGRRDRLQAVVQRWADRLAVQVSRHPGQWNNYYAFWD